jgi:hypothetical protein
MAGNRIPDDPGAGDARGGSPFDPQHTNAPLNARGGFGAETSGVQSSQLSGNVHSSRGFRRALKETQNKSDRLAGQLPAKQHFGGPGFKKPNYFAQGGARRGMHIGSGAPATLPAKGNSQ